MQHQTELVRQCCQLLEGLAIADSYRSGHEITPFVFDQHCWCAIFILPPESAIPNKSRTTTVFARTFFPCKGPRICATLDAEIAWPGHVTSVILYTSLWRCGIGRFRLLAPISTKWSVVSLCTPARWYLCREENLRIETSHEVCLRAMRRARNSSSAAILSIPGVGRKCELGDL